MGSQSPWSRLPLHLIAPPTGSSYQARCYSSDSREAKHDVVEDTRKEKVDSNAAPSRLSSMLGFQSLSGLFQQPARARYSSPKRSEHAAATAESLPGDVSKDARLSAPEPIFVPTTPASQSEASAVSEHSHVKEKNQEQPTAVQFRPAMTAQAKAPVASNQPRGSLFSRRLLPARRVIRKFEVPPFKDTKDTARSRRTAHRSNPFLGDDSFGTNVKAPTTARILPLDAGTPGKGFSRRSSIDEQQSLDSLLDPGMTNVDFQSRRTIEPGPAALPSKSSYSAIENTMETTPQAPVSSSTSQSESAKDIKLTHVTSSGEAHMVDVGAKESTRRIAVAHAAVKFSNPEPFRLIAENANKKGDVLGVARVAGIMASKRTADLIPLCHPIAISKVEMDVQLSAPESPLLFKGANTHGTVTIYSVVECVGPTGVEMEALTAVSGAALTVHDMCKAVDRAVTISSIKVIFKSGGRSGEHVHRVWYETGGREFLKDKGIEVGEHTIAAAKALARSKPPQRPGRRSRR